jgi:hypothetical protein
VDLASAPLHELERTFADDPIGPEPRGVFRGRFLCSVDSPGARKLWVRAADALMFRAPTFGVDFDRQAWWFFRPTLQAGRFRRERRRSRWRTTEVDALTYEASRLPGPVKGLLYDEVKPLSADLLLGLGGINADAGEGDHFFFTLERI